MSEITLNSDLVAAGIDEFAEVPKVKPKKASKKAEKEEE